MNWKNFIIALFYPKKCVICNNILEFKNIENYICNFCSKNIPYIKGNTCNKCGVPIDNGILCQNCFNNSFAFDYGFSAFKYELVKKSLFRFKYKCVKSDGYGIAKIMVNYLLEYHNDIIDNIDLIVSVPIHIEKMKEREFNQSEILAEFIAKELNISYIRDVLIRVRNTVPQNTLNINERKNNVKGAFKVNNLDVIKDKKIMVIDDIFTTGSTINECARVMIMNDAKQVIFFTYATT